MWIKRDGNQVKADATKWKETSAVSNRDKLAQRTGVRWTPLHDLPYWDPVKQLVLGFMHNTLEGILEFHLRDLFGLGRTERERRRKKDVELDELDEEDATEIDSELEELIRESQENTESESDFQAASQSFSIGGPTPPPSDSENTETSEGTVHPDDMDIDDSDYIPLPFGPNDVFNFTNDQVETIRTCIRDISLPTNVNRPPINLGDASHGALKANELLILFTVILPMILPELWMTTEHSAYDAAVFQNFYHLVASTNLISSFSTSPSDADKYMKHYLEYRKTVKQLFPNFRSKPNHHYAMHNDELLKYWGPLPEISEFAGERMNGLLQETNTNRHMCKFNLFISNSDY